MSSVWIEHYRPKKLDDIIGQDNIIKRLKMYVLNGNFPHLMFSGAPGCGKTTAALVLAKEMFGNNWNGNFKELNASDHRGIDTVRNEIKEFASTAGISSESEIDGESKNRVNKFKIILLDECDNLTVDAQAALRRTMEKFSSSCKFILSCNYSSKVIEPIQSRCAIFRFKGINELDMKKRLLWIAEKENVSVNNEALNAIVYVSEGDMRKAINCLEIASLMDENISVDSIYQSSGFTNPENVNELIIIALKGSFYDANDSLDLLMIEEGLSAIDILKQMFKEVMKLNVKEDMKIELIDRIGECDFRISEGSSEMIQMKNLIVQIMKIGK